MKDDRPGGIFVDNNGEHYLKFDPLRGDFTKLPKPWEIPPERKATLINKDSIPIDDEREFFLTSLGSVVIGRKIKPTPEEWERTLDRLGEICQRIADEQA